MLPNSKGNSKNSTYIQKFHFNRRKSMIYTPFNITGIGTFLLSPTRVKQKVFTQNLEIDNTYLFLYFGENIQFIDFASSFKRIT